MIAYISGFGFVISALSLALAAGYETGFFSYLVLAFLVFISALHLRYALARKLRQRQARLIDYWYVGAAVVGLLLYAAAYSEQREQFIAQYRLIARQTTDANNREKVGAALTGVEKWLCVDGREERFLPLCNNARIVSAEVRPGLTRQQIAALADQFIETVAIPYIKMFDSEQRDIHSEIIQKVFVAWRPLRIWQFQTVNEPDRALALQDENTKLLFGLGQLVVWPFFLLYALALRLTKVTIDVLEWAK